MVILATLATISSRLIFASVDVYRQSVQRAQVHARASLAMERVTGELRAVVLASFTPDITSASSVAISFNASTGASRSIAYDAATQTLSITTPQTGSQPLLTGCTDFTLGYFDKDNAPTAVLANIRRIGVTIRAAEGSVVEQLESKVYIRAAMSGSGAS